MDEKFKLKANFQRKEGGNGEGDLEFTGECTTEFLATCLYHIIDEIGEKSRKAVEIATTRYYKKVFDL